MRNTIRLIALSLILTSGSTHAQTAVAVQSPTRAHVERWRPTRSKAGWPARRARSWRPTTW